MVMRQYTVQQGQLGRSGLGKKVLLEVLSRALEENGRVEEADNNCFPAVLGAGTLFLQLHGYGELDLSIMGERSKRL